ncbi:hypothetical protein BpHYR1_015577 [Brachionus plicatilis]|uniref:Uncharacterized protein n=1 Tax=Brachionus plicatilis TaxID=10195 RepID=A0A3M7S5H4_BRAPC|nr:hypothetical protein BpHYR1_015577 [Brachionus plicatilis]
MDFLANMRKPKLKRILSSPDLNESNRTLRTEEFFIKTKKLGDLKKVDDSDNFDSFISTLVNDGVVSVNKAVYLIKILHKILDYRQVRVAIEEAIKMPEINLVCMEILTGLIDEKAETWSLIGFQEHPEVDTDQIRSLSISSLHYAVKNYQYLGSLLFSKLKIFHIFGTLASYLADLLYTLFSNDFFKNFFYSFNSKYKNYGVEENATEQKIDINIFYKIFLCAFVDLLEIFYQQINQKSMSNFLKTNKEYSDRGEILTAEKYFYDMSKLVSLKKLVYSDMKNFVVKNYENWVDLRVKFDNYLEQSFVTSHINKIKLIKVDINNSPVV